MPPSPLALRRAAAVGVLLLLAAAVAVLSPGRQHHNQLSAAAAAAARRPQPGERRPLLVIDAGSSGTRVHAFRLELAGAAGASSALGRRGGPIATTTTKDHHHPFAVRAVDVVPASAAPDALPSAGDGKKGMYERVETRPGLDQVVAGPQGRLNPEAVLRSRALGPLLDWAAAALRATAAEDGGGSGGKRRHSRNADSSPTPAPVFFGGTGGLRRMPPRDRERLLDAARHVLRSDARLAFEGNDKAQEEAPTAAAAAGVLPGAREAAFGWVATNWARGLITPTVDEENKKKNDHLEMTTMGVLDLGGASLEVAFEVEEPEEAAKAAVSTGGAAEEAAEAAAAAAAEDPFARPPSAVVELRVGGAGPVRRVHTHAFHGYGLNEAFDRAVTRLLEEQQQQQQQREQQEQQQEEVAAAAATTPPRRAAGEDERARLALEEQEVDEKQEQHQAQPRAPPPPPLTVAPRRRRLASEADGAADTAAAETATADDAAAEAHAADAAVAAMQAPRPSGRVATVGGDAALVAGGIGGGPHIAPAPPPTPVVRHPCLHAGYEAPYERILHRHSHHADPEQQAHVDVAAAAADAAAAAAPSAGPAVVALVGAPDWPACRRLMSAVVDADAPCARHPRPGAGEECRLGALQPALRGRRFAALSGFEVVWRFLGADAAGGTAALLQAAERWCSAPWPFDRGLAAQLKPDAAHSVNAERYCAWAPYVASLLKEGLGLSDGEFEVGGGGGGGGGGDGAGAKGAARLGAVGWPLGAALVEGPRLLEAAAAAAAGGQEAEEALLPPARRPLLPLLLLGVLAAGVLGLVIAAFGAPSSSSSLSSSSPPRGGWIGLGPAGRGGGGGGGGSKGGGSGNGLLHPPALLPLHTAPSMLSLRSSSFAPGVGAGASAASSPASPRAFATSSSFSFGSSAPQPLQLASAWREASPTLWRSPSPVGVNGQ